MSFILTIILIKRQKNKPKLGNKNTEHLRRRKKYYKKQRQRYTAGLKLNVI